MAKIRGLVVPNAETGLSQLVGVRVNASGQKFDISLKRAIAMGLKKSDVAEHVELREVNGQYITKEEYEGAHVKDITDNEIMLKAIFGHYPVTVEDILLGVKIMRVMQNAMAKAAGEEVDDSDEFFGFDLLVQGSLALNTKFHTEMGMGAVGVDKLCRKAGEEKDLKVLAQILRETPYANTPEKMVNAAKKGMVEVARRTVVVQAKFQAR